MSTNQRYGVPVYPGGAARGKRMKASDFQDGTLKAVHLPNQHELAPGSITTENVLNNASETVFSIPSVRLTDSQVLAHAQTSDYLPKGRIYVEPPAWPVAGEIIRVPKMIRLVVPPTIFTNVSPTATIDVAARGYMALYSQIKNAWDNYGTDVKVSILYPPRTIFNPSSSITYNGSALAACAWPDRDSSGTDIANFFGGSALFVVVEHYLYGAAWNIKFSQRHDPFAAPASYFATELAAIKARYTNFSKFKVWLYGQYGALPGLSVLPDHLYTHSEVSGAYDEMVAGEGPFGATGPTKDYGLEWKGFLNQVGRLSSSDQSVSTETWSRVSPVSELERLLGELRTYWGVTV